MKKVRAPMAIILFLVGQSCSSPLGSGTKPDAAPDDVATDDARDGVTTTDAPRAPDARTSPDGAPSVQCASQPLCSSCTSVRGTVRGPKVEGEVCENGVFTTFNGPNGGYPSFLQVFDTNRFPGSQPDHSVPGPSVYGFLIRQPLDALSGYLLAQAGAPAAKVGSYDSSTNCGLINFQVALPIPAGTVCPNQFSPCDPGCSPGGGEMAICAPANPTRYYHARSAVSCGSSSEPARGSWNLTLTEIVPLPDPDPYLRYTTHGHLQATLVNQDDPTDSVALSLDF